MEKPRKRTFWCPKNTENAISTISTNIWEKIRKKKSEIRCFFTFPRERLLWKIARFCEKVHFFTLFRRTLFPFSNIGEKIRKMTPQKTAKKYTFFPLLCQNAQRILEICRIIIRKFREKVSRLSLNIYIYRRCVGRGESWSLRWRLQLEDA